MPNRINAPSAVSDVKMGSVDVGTGANRYVEIAALFDGSNLGNTQQYTSCNVGGVDLPLTLVHPSPVDLHGEFYAGAIPDGLTGSQTWALVGTPTGLNWHTAITVYDDVGSSVATDTSLVDSFSTDIDLAADVQTGDLATMMTYSWNTVDWVFDAPLVEFRNENPGSPAARIANGDFTVLADETAKPFGGEYVSFVENKFGYLNILRGPGAANTAPLLGAIGSLSATVGVAFSKTITWTDDDIGATLAATGLPAWLTLSAVNDTTALLSGTPPDTTGSPFTLNFTLTDVGSLTDTELVTLTVTAQAETDRTSVIRDLVRPLIDDLIW